MAGRFEGVYNYVPNGFLYLWEQVGWKALPALTGTSHGLYSTLCKWEGEGEAIYPMKEEAEPEEWRSIAGYEGFYEVSSLGRVRSLDRILVKPEAAGGYPKRVKGVVLKPHKAGSGYLFVSLSSPEGVKRARYIAHLVAEAFIGPRPDGDIHVAHCDGDKTNNCEGNLRYATRAENEADKDAHGTRPRGEQCSFSKLTAAEVNQIRSLAGTMSQREIAKIFGVSPTSISLIISRETWAA